MLEAVQGVGEDDDLVSALDVVIDQELATANLVGVHSCQESLELPWGTHVLGIEFCGETRALIVLKKERNTQRQQCLTTHLSSLGTRFPSTAPMQETHLARVPANSPRTVSARSRNSVCRFPRLLEPEWLGGARQREKKAIVVVSNKRRRQGRRI